MFISFFLLPIAVFIIVV